MGKKWEEIKIINLRNENFDMKTYEQIVDEVAGILYSEICRLHKESISDSSASNNNLERTGTDA